MDGWCVGGFIERKIASKPGSPFLFSFPDLFRVILPEGSKYIIKIMGFLFALLVTVYSNIVVNRVPLSLLPGDMTVKEYINCLLVL